MAVERKREDTGFMQWEDGACEIHGDRLIVECRMCGREFCGLCASDRRVCRDCAEEDEGDDLSLDDDESDAMAHG